MNIKALKYNKLLPLVKVWELFSPYIKNDKFYLKIQCFLRTDCKRILNIDNPITFNDKINWLKLYCCKPEYTQMVDKYAVKEYVSSRIGQKYIIPTICIFDDLFEVK